MRLVAVAALALVAGCVDPPDEHARPTPPPPAARPVAPPPSLPPMAEVELSGTVMRPAGQKGEITVWITDGPCWQPATHAFNATKTIPDKFFVEVFVPQGTQLWVCAALGDGAKPMSFYGQADQAPLLGKGTGEVTFPGLTVTLRKGKPVSAPPKAPPPATATR